MRIQRLAALFAVATIVAACGGTQTSTGSPPTSAGPATPSTPPAASSDTGAASPSAVTGTVQLWYLEDPEFTFLPAIKERFEAAYPGITVELTEIPEDGYVTKVDTALLAGQPPDIGFIYEPRWMKAGSVMPLDDVVASAGIDLSTFNQTAMSPCELDGKLYCLGSLGGSVQVIYNKAMFDAKGLPYPSTTQAMPIDEYSALARKLYEPNDDPNAVVWGSTADVPFWWTDRSTHFSPDGRTIAGLVNDDATAHMYDVLATMARDGIAPSPTQAEAASAADMLGAGDVAMAITDVEVGASSLEKAGFAWGAAPPPIEAVGSTPFVFTGTDQYGIFSKAPNPEAAKLFMAYLGKEGSKIRVEVSDDPPIDSNYIAQWAGDNPGRKQVGEVMSLTSKTPLIPGFWDVTAPLGDLFSLMVSGEAQPKAALDEEAPNLQDSLDQQWETWDSIK